MPYSAVPHVVPASADETPNNWSAEVERRRTSSPETCRAANRYSSKGKAAQAHPASPKPSQWIILVYQLFSKRHLSLATHLLTRLASPQQRPEETCSLNGCETDQSLLEEVPTHGGSMSLHSERECMPSGMQQTGCPGKGTGYCRNLSEALCAMPASKSMCIDRSCGKRG